MVMKLYGAEVVSYNVQRAVLPLFFADVDIEKELELVKVTLFGGQHFTPAYIAKQPFSFVPYFEDGDICIWESRAIAKYIVDKYELTFLSGKTLKERAIITQWTEAETNNFYQAMFPMVRDGIFARVQNRPADANLIATGLEKTGKYLDILEAHLAKNNKYLAGETYTLADLFHTPYIELVRTLEVFEGQLDSRPHLKAWAEDITSNPAFLKCQQMNWAEATQFVG